MEKKWKSFMAHIQHEHIEYVEDTLKDYDIGKYIIGMEHADSVGDHLHFLVQMTDTDYHKFSKRVFKDKFKLRGQNRGGKCKQYGMLKEIRDLEKMTAYTVKDGNVKTNMSDKEIKKYTELSYKKEDKLELLDELADLTEKQYLEEQEAQYGPEEHASPTFHPNRIRMIIIDIMRKKNLKTISRSRVENVLYRFLMKTGTAFHATTQDIFDCLYGFG